MAWHDAAAAADDDDDDGDAYLQINIDTKYLSSLV